MASVTKIAIFFFMVILEFIQIKKVYPVEPAEECANSKSAFPTDE